MADKPTSPFYKALLLYDVTYVIEFTLDEKTRHLLPRQSINARFRTYIGDEGFEGHCGFQEGHYRAKRALLTPDEISTMIDDCKLEYQPEGPLLGDPGVHDEIELDNVLYFKAGGMYGYQALFVTLPRGHHKATRNALIDELKDALGIAAKDEDFQRKQSTPDQEELNESILISDDRREARLRGKIYFKLPENVDDGSDSPIFWRSLSELMEQRGDFHLRLFHVNDHGNVTEYDQKGNVIGEWV